MLARGVERRIAGHGERYPFQRIRSTLRRADVVIANLECVLSKRPFTVSHEYRLRADPKRARILSPAGVTVVNLANNHAMDCGPEGLRDTTHALDAAGVAWCGGAAQPLLVRNVHGIRIAFFGFCDFPPAGQTGEQSGISYASDEGIDRAVRAARKQVDVVVVSFHWGVEHQHRPIPRQRHLARIAAKAGADLVLGHHPHVLQGFEVLPCGLLGRKTLVAYSLGNFVFDEKGKDEQQSLILRCTLDKDGIHAAEALPVFIDKSAARLASAAEAAVILRRLRTLSSEYGVTLTGRHIILNKSVPPRTLAGTDRSRGSTTARP